jgi:predicted PurR-regulated permease PerM
LLTEGDHLERAARLNSRKTSHHGLAQVRIPSRSAAETGANDGAESRREGIRRAIAQFTRMTLLVLCAIGFAYFARSVVLPVLLAWVGSMVLNSPVRWLAERHLPKYFGALLVVGIAVLAVSYGAYNLGRPAVEWAKSAPDKLPALNEKLKRLMGPAAGLIGAASRVSPTGDSDGSAPKPQPVEVKDNRMAGSIFSWTGGVLGGAAETIVLLFMLLASGDLFGQKLLQEIPIVRDKQQAKQICREIEQSVSCYLQIVGLVNVILGALVGLSLYLLGLPNAAMWGGVAAFLNFIPYFGPFAGIFAVAMAGLLCFDSLGRGLMPAGAYLLLHLLEADLVTPFVVGRHYALNPVVIFVSLMFFAWLWGLVGALLAVPLLVTAKAVCDRIAVLSSLGYLLSG